LASQGFFPMAYWPGLLWKFAMTHAGMGSFDSAARFAERIVLLR